MAPGPTVHRRESSHTTSTTHQTTKERVRGYLRSRRTADKPLTTLRERLRDCKLITKGKSILPPWLQTQPRQDSAQYFIPCPKITFIIDDPPPPKLTCQICRDTSFELRSVPLGIDVDDATFSLLPCGHVAGSRCLEKWCSAYGACPFCRMELHYPGCRHPVPPRPITDETIHVLPRTLPDGGALPSLCRECHWSWLAVDAERSLAARTQRFRTARERADRTGSAADEQRLLDLKDEVETGVRDELHYPYLSRLLDSW
ncbi:putative RING finger protein-like protein [Hapsidospora chrysogenum ATCC 11550]|uniref:Putative RING finger protein-like protein n=1 Tax=Hapsidospora chrysogenum (strain ATCC 11550 / CBS 779.69 / DSM 880 / IAM 14645 / JCM 23072 / IMI 49137) TaxID=857340 RepID=A0A086TCR4_HAPC1|nr:putative RING finger protein-like protein [Hapsidospora chrysogenum ATCC 11550]